VGPRRPVQGRGAAPEPVLLAELLALRAILLNLYFAIGRGEPITAETMRRLIDRADEDKLQHAYARLVPLMSLWLDMLVLRLMSVGHASQRPVWFILDELASLQRLPQLHTAITENRKSNNPVVLGFQGRSQIETRYGHDAEAMLSQPATKIFLRTSEPHAAKWILDTIGDRDRAPTERVDPRDRMATRVSAWSARSSRS
jgi:type IV secretory pathway TraG/TraD family ATPase VirD4